MVIQSDIPSSKFWFFWHKMWNIRKENQKVNVHTCSLSSARELSAYWKGITWSISTPLRNELYNLDLYWSLFLESPCQAWKAILANLLTPKTPCMKRTSVHFKNMWIKQLCNHKVWDFVTAFWVQKFFRTFKKQASGWGFKSFSALF